MIHTDRARPGLSLASRWRRPAVERLARRIGGGRRSCAQRAPLFEGSTRRAHGRSAADARRQAVRGEHLFLEGQDGDRLYVVMDGKLKLTRRRPTAGKTCSAWSGRRDVRRAVAVRPAARLLGQRGHRRDAGGAGPRHAALLAARAPDVSMHMLQALARRLRRPTTSWPIWSSPTCRDGWPRTCSTWRPGSANRNATAARPHDLTQEELAQLVGASRETVNKPWRTSPPGLAADLGRSVLILDTERLRKRAR